ncbi:MAG TPA: pyridoxamine 5'-phosphate oxidase family protein [Xanthobacteraceae bacterium]|nr:pyridoxamine 5'-phosphate oxidase family protein [Xanthobacteraceae bacterium]
MTDHLVKTVAELEAMYAQPVETSLLKEIDHIGPHYRALIEASPFVALATCGPEGLDCSPRGDAAGFVRIADERTLLIPDRRGNNRIDTLRNIVRDPRVALLFLIPGVSETMRVNGRAAISTDPELCESFTVDGKVPRCVIVVTVERAYFQCAKAIVRSKLWDPATRIERTKLPSTGAMVAALTRGKVDAETYDREAPARIKAHLY